MESKEKDLWTLAAVLFKLVDQTTDKKEAAELGTVVRYAKSLFDDYHNAHPDTLHPDLGLELSEFADLKDDCISDPVNGPEELASNARTAALRILQAHSKKQTSS